MQANLLILTFCFSLMFACAFWFLSWKFREQRDHDRTDTGIVISHWIVTVARWVFTAIVAFMLILAVVDRFL